MAARPQVFRGNAGTRKEAAARVDDRRGTAHERGYTGKWSKASKGFLFKHPLCIGCQAVGRIEPATLTDHIMPHRGDKALFWDRSNWQPSCAWHHNVVKKRLELLFDRGRVKAAELALDAPYAVGLTRQLLGG